MLLLQTHLLACGTFLGRSFVEVCKSRAKSRNAFPESFGPVAMPPDFLQLQAVPKDFAL
jgi:hypothetical protein